jgi:magnesium transporter
LNSGLRLCSTTILYPLIFCIYNIISILDGLIYYQQTSRLTHLQIIFVAIGTAILLTGVLSLSWRLSPEPGPPPTTPLAPNPFSISPEYELFVDDCRDDVEEEPPSPAVDNRRRRALSQVEVEGLKDLLGDIDDDTSTINDEEQEINIVPLHRV